MSISSCPQCGKQVTIPAGVGTSAKVRCPLCHSHYTLADALVNMPPLLELVDEDIEGSLDTQPDIPGGLTVAQLAQLSAEPAPEATDEPDADIDFGESDINALGNLEEPADEEAASDALGLDVPLDLESTTAYVAPEDQEAAHDLDDLTVEDKDTEIEDFGVSGAALADDTAEEHIAFEADSADDGLLDFGADLSADEPAAMSRELDEHDAALNEGEGDAPALDFGGAPSAESDEEAPIEFGDELTAGSESDDAPTIDFDDAEVTEASGDADEMALDFGQPVEAEEPAITGEAEAAEEPEETDKKGKKKKKKEKTKKVKAAADGEPRPKRKMSTVLSATMGGMLGLLLALYGMLWLGPDYDILGMGKILPGFMVPGSVNKPTYVATQKPALDMPPVAQPQEPLPDQPAPDEPPADDMATPDAAAEVPAEPAAGLPADNVPADEAPADDMPAELPPAGSAPADTASADTAPSDDLLAPAEEPAASPPDPAGASPLDAPAEMPADDSAPGFPAPEAAAAEPPSEPDFPPAADEPATDPSADPFAPSSDTPADASADPFAPSAMPAEPAIDAPPAEAPAADAITDAPPTPGPDATATTTPAPPIAQPPAAEMPAPADDPFADTATTPGETDDPFADSPIQPEAPAEPAPEPVGPVDAEEISPAALAQAIQAAEAADQQMVAAQGTAAEAELKRIRANFYVSLFRMADGATFAKDDAQSDQLDQMRQEMDRFMRELTNDPKRVESLKYNAGHWLGFPRRTTPGIILAGKVQSVEPVGKLHEIKLNIGLANAAESIVSVLSASDPGVANGDDAVVLGSIVENPAQALAGYEGSESDGCLERHAVEFVDAVDRPPPLFDSAQLHQDARPPSGPLKPTMSQAPASIDADLIQLSASEMARQIAAGLITSEQLVEAHIRRIEAVNPALNAVVANRFDLARREAAAADRARAAGRPLAPLHGVPITIKECFHVAGMASTEGVHRFAHELMAHDNPLVRRLKQAGAIVLAKTNLPQLMLMHETDNPLYGRTNNPWDLERAPGGSSGGEAAIIAAGGSPLGLGNDLGGSIRFPAHSVGICGIKPTVRRLTNADVRDNLHGMEAILPQSGPLAQSRGGLVAGAAYSLRAGARCDRSASCAGSTG